MRLEIVPCVKGIGKGVPESEKKLVVQVTDCEP